MLIMFGLGSQNAVSGLRIYDAEAKHWNLINDARA